MYGYDRPTGNDHELPIEFYGKDRKNRNDLKNVQRIVRQKIPQNGEMVKGGLSKMYSNISKMKLKPK